MIKAIFVDAGHGLGPTGAIDNGASGNGTTERQEVVEIASELCVALRQDPALTGVEIVRVGIDERLRLVDHIRVVNDACHAKGWTSADCILISIHLNSGPAAARGIEAWYSPAEGTLDFARSLVQHVSATTGMPARAKPALTTQENRWGRLGIIDDTIPRAVLIEAGFVSNEFDAAVLKDQKLDDKITLGIHQAIRAYLGGAGPVSSPTVYTVPVAQPPPSVPGLQDVPASAWFARDVALCIREGLFQQPTNGRFHPAAPVNRAELAAVLARLLRRFHHLS